MLRIFTPVKIQRLRPGLNPQTWVPEASMLTTRPPKLSSQSITASFQTVLIKYRYSRIHVTRLRPTLLTNSKKLRNYGICVVPNCKPIAVKFGQFFSNSLTEITR